MSKRSKRSSGSGSESEYQLSAEEDEEEYDSSGSDAGTESEYASEAMTSADERPRTKKRRRVPPPAATATTTAASSSSSSLSATLHTLPPPPSMSMRFASTGETAQGELAASQQPMLQRSSSVGALNDNTSPLTQRTKPSDPSRPHICTHPGCGKSFTKVGKLNRHFLSHTGVKSFTCTHPGCGKSFTRNDRLRRHWKIHQNEADGGRNQRRKIGGKFDKLPGNADADDGMEMRDDDHDDDDQQSSDGTIDDSLKKRSSSPRKKSTAALPLQSLPSSRVADEHDPGMMSGSDIEPIIPSAILRPTLDGTTALSSLPPTATLLPSQLPPLVKFSCHSPGCNLSFLLKEHLKRHEETIHVGEVLRTEEERLKEEKEEEERKQEAERKRLEKEEAKRLEKEQREKLLQEKQSSTNKRSYPCTHLGCFLTFDKAHKLREHSYVHTGIMPWICGIGVGMRSDGGKMPKLSLNTDDEDEEGSMSDTTNNVTATSAPSAAASSSSAITSPFKLLPPTISPKLAPITAPAAGCSSSSSTPLCSEGFLTRKQLLKHQHLHHGPSRFICSTCSAGFSRFLDLKKHETEKHRAASLTCPTCGHQAPRKQELTAHLRTHMTAEERAAAGFLFTCPFTHVPYECKKTFTTRSNLTVHIRACHDAGWKVDAGKGGRGGKAKSVEEVMKERMREKGEVAVVDGDVEEMKSNEPTSITPVPTAVVVLRYPCPFVSCTRRAISKPYAYKQTLQKHLMSAHGLTHEQSRDPAYIEEEVKRAEERGDQLPPHHSSRRKKTALVQLTGSATPYRKTKVQDGAEASTTESAATAASTSSTNSIPPPSVTGKRKRSADEDDQAEGEQKQQSTPPSFLASVFSTSAATPAVREPDSKRTKLDQEISTTPHAASDAMDTTTNEGKQQPAPTVMVQ